MGNSGPSEQLGDKATVVEQDAFLAPKVTHGLFGLLYVIEGIFVVCFFPIETVFVSFSLGHTYLDIPSPSGSATSGAEIYLPSLSHPDEITRKR